MCHAKQKLSSFDRLEDGQGEVERTENSLESLKWRAQPGRTPSHNFKGLCTFFLAFLPFTTL